MYQHFQHHSELLLRFWFAVYARKKTSRELEENGHGVNLREPRFTQRKEMLHTTAENVRNEISEELKTAYFL